MLLKGKNIASTHNTPEVKLDPEGIIRISGRSMIQDITVISKPIDTWIDHYLHSPADLTCVDFYLEYINTTNVKFYISLLTRIETLRLKDKKYTINWYYDEGDEDIIEKGEYISSVVEIPFNFIVISDPLISDKSPRDDY
jgi:hypothetical protein